jgi:hypothetical protein
VYREIGDKLFDLLEELLKYNKKIIDSKGFFLGLKIIVVIFTN